MTKLCHNYNTVKNKESFHKDNRTSDGVKTQCKECRSNYVKRYRVENREHMKNKSKIWYHSNKSKSREGHYRRLYGLTEEKYQELFVKQKSKCALCPKEPTNSKRLCVDHDHKTGEIRGFKCVKCNAALGIFGDNVEGLTKVLQYLGGSK